MQPSRRPGAGSRSPEKVFGRILQQARRKRGLSQEELGFQSGYHPTYISQIERGVKNPSLRTILTLASALKVSVSYMLRRVEVQLGEAGKRQRRTP